MAEQADRRNHPRERDLEKAGTDSGKALDWVSRPPEKPSKELILTRNAHSLALFLSEARHSAKMVRTIIVRRNYLHFAKKYQRYEKRHSNIPAHMLPCFHVKEGDHVIIGQCRPLSKTVRFNVLKVIPAGSSGGGKKAFTGM